MTRTACLPRLEPFEGRVLLAAVPELIADVNRDTRDALPPLTPRSTEMLEINGTLFFAGQDGIHSRPSEAFPTISEFELWKTDGTAAGTVMVKDILPGSVGSDPHEFVAANGLLFFVAHNGVDGWALWKSDGTEAGTTLVKAGWGDDLLDAPMELAAVGGTVYFEAQSAFGRELWKSDGTDAGTVVVKDINPGGNSAWAFNDRPRITDVGGQAYFQANDGSGMKLWRTDGTERGTAPAPDQRLGSLLAPGKSARFRGLTYFAGLDDAHGQELWRTDGTEAGTTLFRDLNPGTAHSCVGNMVVADDALYFTANDGRHGYELWKTDGTSAGTVLVKDLGVWYNPSGDPANLTYVNGFLFFSADGADGGYELWRSDGTEPGTIRLASWTSLHNDAPESFVGVGGRLYFVADDDSPYDGSRLLREFGELWTSDGTMAGTGEVADIRPGPFGSEPGHLTTVAGRLYFSADDGTHGRELWAADGATGATALVADVNRVSGDSSDLLLAPLGEEVIFAADDGVAGQELWRTDGTSLGTSVLADLVSGEGGALGDWSDSSASVVPMDGAVYFRATTASFKRGVWRTDGTAVGTGPMTPSDVSTDTADLTAAGRTLFFSARTGSTGWELWKSDGTPAGTSLVKDIRPGSGDSVSGDESGRIRTRVALGNVLYFMADDGVHGNELWKSDGTAAGTVLVKDVRAGTSGSEPQYLTAVGGTLYFIADDGTNGRELWRSDGTVDGTVLVRDVRPGAGSAFPPPTGSERLRAGLTDVDGTLFFFANDGVHGAEPWKTDGTVAGTVLVKDIAVGVGSADTVLVRGSEVAFRGAFYFRADDDVHGAELWKSDGTAGGTVMVRDIQSPDRDIIYPGSIPWLMTVHGDTLYFTADDWTHGRELWKTDGTTQGTVLVADLFPGWRSSWPVLGVSNAGTLYFTADDGVHGYEPWRLVDDVAPTVARSAFEFRRPKPALRFTFSEILGDAPDAGDFSIINLSTGQPVPAAALSVTGEPSGTAVSVSFPGLAGAYLPDGNYRVTLKRASVADAGGNALAADYSFDFHVLAGDANGDGTVNFADLVGLAQNYNKVGGVTFDKGDFNYDGRVDFRDLVMLAQRYNAPAAAAAAAAPSVAAKLSAAAAAPSVILPEVEASAAPVFSSTPVTKPKPAAAKPRSVARPRRPR